MKFLYDSKGMNIANLAGGSLHTPAGLKIGLFHHELGLFTNLDGFYLGEIILDNRLAFKPDSPYRTTSLATSRMVVAEESEEGYEPVGVQGIGNAEPVQLPSNYKDIPKRRLRKVMSRQTRIILALTVLVVFLGAYVLGKTYIPWIISAGAAAFAAVAAWSLARSR